MSKVTQEFRQAALRSGIALRNSETHEVDVRLLHAAVVEMASLGFLVRFDQIEGMSGASLSEMINEARVIVGADRNMRPIYPGFPKQVQELSTATLLFEQIMHYWSGGALLPDYPDVIREGLPLEDAVRSAKELQVLTAGDAARLFMRSLTTRGVALSEQERDLVRGSVTLANPSLDEVSAILRDSRNGENMQVLVGAVKDLGTRSVNDIALAALPSCKNSDQILRVVLTLAGNPVPGREVDFALAVNTLADRKATAVRMSNLSRPVRRALVKRLGEVSDGFKADAILARTVLWRRVMRMVHPYDLALSEATKRAVDIIHGNIEHRTLNSLVEEHMAAGNGAKVTALLSENAPGNLLRRLVAILRISKSASAVNALSKAVETVGSKAAITTLISAYNGVLSANSTQARVTRVAGINNTLRTSDAVKVSDSAQKKVLASLRKALVSALSKTSAPQGVVGVSGDNQVPLVRRDLSTSDRTLDRGERIALAGKGDTIRMFTHWRNNQKRGGYMDTGVVVLDSEFSTMAVATWNTANDERQRVWSTYSGDCHVSPGDSAAEYFDVDTVALKAAYPKAAWIAMTIQSYSGFPTNEVDIIAGVMLRSKPNSGEAFDPRSLVTAFKPTSAALQTVPLVVNLATGEMVWIDSSSGSNEAGASASNDETVGSIVYDEVVRPRLTMGELAALWAEAHGASTVEKAVDREAILGLLN